MATSNPLGHVFIAPGDLIQLRADVVVYSSSTAMRRSGCLYATFAERFPWFAQALAAAVPEVRSDHLGCAVGQASCLEPPGGKCPAVVGVASTIDLTLGAGRAGDQGRLTV